MLLEYKPLRTLPFAKLGRFRLGKFSFKKTKPTDMNPKKFVLALWLAMPMAGCSDLPAYYWPSTVPSERPFAYHDTRLQYALVAGEEETLAKDFDMKLPPSLAERIVAGVDLPFTATMETIFWPFSAGIKAYAPIPEYQRSDK